MRTITIFDCNCSYGVTPKPPHRYSGTAKDLISEMDFCGIDKALVHHAGMRFANPVEWNEVLLQEVHTAERLEPVFAIMPEQTSEQQKPEDFLTKMRTHNIRALWAFPNEHNYILNKATFGNFFEMLSEYHVPLFIKANILRIGELLADFPDLRAVAVNQGPHSIERFSRPLFDRYPNLYLETSSYIIDGLLEEFCRLYGSHRLLFGSGYPNNCSGASLWQLLNAELEEETKQAIAGVNLETLLKEASV